MNFYFDLVEKIKSGIAISKEESQKILDADAKDLHKLIYTATEVKNHFVGNVVDVCSITNAKSGLCSEDCKYCAQSAHYKTGVEIYDLKTPEIIIEEVKNDTNLSERFGIVTSGKKLNKNEIQQICKTIKMYYQNNLKIPCASLGILSQQDFTDLKNAGLVRYHHNLETSRNYYPKICTTHSYQQRIDTINNAKSAGLELCVGGIFGMGETIEDRIDFLFEIKEINPDSVPINFLIPIKGTALQNQSIISFLDAVKIITLARLVLPEKVIKIAAGRLEIFSDAQDIIYLAGANGIISGNLLTVKGRKPAADASLIKQLGLITRCE